MASALPRSVLLTVLILLPVSPALAEAAVERTFKALPSSNGYGAILADLATGKLTHFREHLYAVEEPLLDGAGKEVGDVKSRDLLFDAYVGLRAGGTQRWLSSVPVELDASGYLPYAPGAAGGTGVVHWRQSAGGLEVTTYAFAPRALPRAGFVLAVQVKNAGDTAVPGVSVFSLHNFHLGFGRPGVGQELQEAGETVLSNGEDLLERAFAGAVLTRALQPVTHRAAWNFASPEAQNGFLLVQGGGAADLPDVATGSLGVGTGWAHAFQFDLGELAPGATRWAGVVVAHHGDPFGDAQLAADVGAYVNGRDAQALVEAEREAWASLQGRVKLPPGTSAAEQALLRQSAAMLAMAQVREESVFLREWLATDGEVRRTRALRPDGGVAALPAVVAHRGKGALLASLPPGEWTYAWARDSAYAIAGLATLGLNEEAKEGLGFLLRAEGGRFRAWMELASYGMPPYQISLTRYQGFGVEETDFNGFGPNLELDGFGLFLWALRLYEERSADTAFVDAQWPLVAEKVADPLVALVDPATGLMRKDSSIWETHWNGRERTWAYTNITAIRGLCDAAAIARRRGDAARQAKYQTAALALRTALLSKGVAPDGTLASNLEELKSGGGYADAAALEVIALGLVEPRSKVALATLDTVERELRVSAGAGFARNDDRKDHAGKTDLSPWGSEYDSAEWVFTDLRAALALRLAGRTARADAVLDWVTRQSAANYGAFAETYDEGTGRYKFNAPMTGFGAGVYALALAQRAAGALGPACGAFPVELLPDGGMAPDAGSKDAGVDAGGADGGSQTVAQQGCGCSGVPVPALALWTLAAALGLWRARRR